MSDPVTNVEIEDVLSSIRRLVSEDARPRAAKREAPMPDRLVLTPALRVQDVDAKPSTLVKGPFSGSGEGTPAAAPQDASRPASVEAPVDAPVNASADAGQGAETPIVSTPILLTNPTEIESDDLFEVDQRETDPLQALVAEEVLRALTRKTPAEETVEDPAPEAEAKLVVETAPATQSRDVMDFAELADKTLSEMEAWSARLARDEIASGTEEQVGEVSDEEADPAVMVLQDEPIDKAIMGDPDYDEESELDEILSAIDAETEDSGSFGMTDETLERKIAALEKLFRDQSDEAEKAETAREIPEVERHEASRETVVEDWTADNAAEAAALPPGALERAESGSFEESAPVSDEAQPEGEPNATAQEQALAEDLVDETAQPEEEVADVMPTFRRHAEALDWEDHSPEASSRHAVAAGGTYAAPQETLLEDAPDHVSGHEVGHEERPQGTQLPALDEEALHQLVVDIVRQELQGALGERITRNVRKLVRREIHRVMMTQDID